MSETLKNDWTLDVEAIKRTIYVRGVFGALVLLREEQDAERYENCSKIKSAIEEVLNGRWYGISTDVSDGGLDKTLENISSEMNNPQAYKDSANFIIHEFMAEMEFQEHRLK